MIKKIGVVIAAGALLLLAIWLMLFTPLQIVISGEEHMIINYNEKYIEPGVDGKAAWLFPVQVETSGTVNTGVLGTYSIEYKIKYAFSTVTRTRIVEVKDIEAPKFTVEDNLVLNSYQDSPVQFPDYSLSDNYDDTDKVVMSTSNLDIGRIGTQFATITFTDTHGNSSSYIQPIVVHPLEEDAVKVGKISEGVHRMNIKDSVLKIFGYTDDINSSVVLNKQSGGEVGSYTADRKYEGYMQYFETEIDLSTLENGTYTFNLKTDKASTRLYHRYLLTQDLLGRWKIDDKLVTFDYNDGINIVVTDFEYEYDIAIDVGHGNADVGAIGIGMYERDLNLEVTMYEKQRYEQHGLRVWVNRTTKNYSAMIGESDWKILHRVSHTLGWYGAVSRYAYSNHHNSNETRTTKGHEIIVIPETSIFNSPIEYILVSEFRGIYPDINTKWEIFTRSYNTGARINMIGGSEVSGERIYYANMRYPWECYGVRVTTYEGAYINNYEEYNWYVNKKGWKEVSEAKIKAYVEALGLEYIEP